MITIWKFEIPVKQEFGIPMPALSKVIHVEVQRQTGKPCIWVEVDTENKIEERFFELYDTGHEIPSRDGLVHIGTFQPNTPQPMVFHLYEKVSA